MVINRFRSGAVRAALASATRPGVTPALAAMAVVFAAALTGASAQVSVPLPATPVPFTLQPLVVLLAGATLGARLGAASQALYLALGAIGFPVFAASPILPQGLARLAGPTGGFLLAFPIAAFVVGALADRGWLGRQLGASCAMGLGLVVIYVGGVAGLMSSTGSTFAVAVAQGAGIFFAADLVKAVAAATVLPSARRWLGRA